MEELKDYVKLLELGQPDFIEIKGAVPFNLSLQRLAEHLPSSRSLGPSWIGGHFKCGDTDVYGRELSSSS